MCSLKKIVVLSILSHDLNIPLLQMSLSFGCFQDILCAIMSTYLRVSKQTGFTHPALSVS